MIKHRIAIKFLVACIISSLWMGIAFAAPRKHGHETILSKGFSYQIGPVPTFVKPLKEMQQQESSSKDIGNALYDLYDIQVSLLGHEPEEFIHLKSRALTSTALQDISQVYLTFNPAYQKLVLHAIRVWRDGKVIDLTHGVKLDLIRREDDLEKNMYEGNVTAVGVLPDTRVNDVIDVEYSLIGANPIFGNRFAQVYSVTQPYPVGQFHLALLTRENRPVKVQPPQGATVKELKEKAAIRYVVEMDHLKPLPVEDKTPYWYRSGKYVQVSEYRDWAEVSKWANNLFKTDGALSSEIQNQLEVWKNASLPQDQETVEVLQWVQSKIRYFGIELGVNSHLPAQPNLTVERKFGDCKDKSFLMVTLLKELGVDAEPALASLSLGRNVENMIPSPALFDHVIVRVIINGRTYWLDPTLPPQYGKLEKLGASEYGGVLVLDQKSSQLQFASLPPDYQNSYQKIDHFKIDSYRQPVQLTVQVKANFSLAEYMRYAHESQSKDEFRKHLQEDILRIYPKAKPVGEVEFSDDKINNQVTATLKFTIEDFCKYEPGRLTTLMLGEELLGWATFPSVSQRITPYSLPSHSRVSETYKLDFPEESTLTPNKSGNTKAGEFWTLTSNYDIQPKRLVQNWTLKANKEIVPPQKISEYTAETREMRDQLGLTFKMPVGHLSENDKQKIRSKVKYLDSIYGNSTSERVRVQMKDVINLFLTSRDIESGKLNDKQLAEAYKIRSEAYDDMGYVAHALDDIRAAIKLAPDNADYIVSEADTLQGNAQFEAANSLYEQVINMGNVSQGDVVHVYRSYGESLHYVGNNVKAKEMLDKAIPGDSGVDMLYTAFWRYIVSGHDANATDILKSAMSNAQDHSWPYPVGEMLLGRLTPEQLINSAGSQDRGIQEDQYCEAYFYIGQKYLLDTNKEKAKESFQKSLDQGVTPYMENNYSLHELNKAKLPENNEFLLPL